MKVLNFYDASGLYSGDYKKIRDAICFRKIQVKNPQISLKKVLQPNDKGHQHDSKPMFQRMDGKMVGLAFL